MESSIFISFSILLLSLHGIVLSDNPCENGWEPYKEEKCLKIFDEPGLSNYTEAEAFCREQDNATLISIGSLEKQLFLENFFTSKSIVDYVWIGLEYADDGSFVWTDGTQFLFSNWAAGSPKNESDHCFQIQTDEAEFGQWSDVSCTKRNVVLCEKIQLWSLSHLQEVVIQLMNQQTVPIGFVYVQLPNETSPAEIWPSMTWVDISEYYAGVFFRVEGGNSSSFGDVQEENSPRLISSTLRNVTGSPSVPSTNEIAADGQPHVAFLNYCCTSTIAELYLTVSAGEVRPRNMAIRLWKRVG